MVPSFATLLVVESRFVNGEGRAVFFFKGVWGVSKSPELIFEWRGFFPTSLFSSPIEAG